MSVGDFQTSIPSRLSVMDALRAFALFGLFLVHMEEHYNLFLFPETSYCWLAALDKAIPKVVYFFFGGKSYAIFAFFFGLSFFIQMDRHSQKGVDFSLRFLWRLAILFFIGFIHGLVYAGDILSFLAVTGLVLIWLYRWPSYLLWPLAIILLLQTPLVVDLIHMFMDPSYRPKALYNEMITLYGNSTPVYKDGNLGDVVAYNWYLGKKASWLYMYLYGRLYQTLGLFVIGILVGRSRFFENLEVHSQTLRTILIVSVLVFLPLYILQYTWIDRISDPYLKEVSGAVLASYANLAFGIGLCCSFIMIYKSTASKGFWVKLSAVGRMGLSNYVMQSLVMVPLLYGFGTGLYDDLSTTWSFLLGTATFALQLAFSNWWLSRYHYGPLEWLWRSATFLKKDIPLRRNV